MGWAGRMEGATEERNKVSEQRSSRDQTSARLIAAAPELLTVAKACLGFFLWQRAQRCDMAPDEAWLRPLREAIARAED